MFYFLWGIGLVLMAQTTTGDEDAANLEWPQWRGPDGTGYVADRNLPTEWSQSENIRWKTRIPGRGHSTPVVIGRLVILTSAIPVGEKLPPRMSGRPGEHDNLPIDSKQQFVVVALDNASGEVVWKTVVHEQVPIEAGHVTASLASASPVSDGELIFASFGSHGLYCLDMDGKVVWNRQFGQMHSKHGHGEGASPVLYGDKLIVNWDHEEQSFITALNKSTGDTIWRCERNEETSWSTPVIASWAGQTQLIVAGTQRVRSYDLSTGEDIWECGGMSSNIVATPVYANGIVVVGSSYEKRVMLAIALDGARGDITDTDKVLWSRIRGTPYVPSMLLADDGVYFLAHYQNILTRVNLNTGAESPGAMRLGELGSIYASPVGAGDYIYVTDLEGTTMVLSKGAEPRQIAINRLNENVNASLAFGVDDIFIRGVQHLYCIGR